MEVCEILAVQLYQGLQNHIPGLVGGPSGVSRGILGAGGKISRRLRFDIGGEVDQRHRRITSDIEVSMNDNEFTKRILFGVLKVPLDSTKDPISNFGRHPMIVNIIVYQRNLFLKTELHTENPTFYQCFFRNQRGMRMRESTKVGEERDDPASWAPRRSMPNGGRGQNGSRGGRDESK